MRERFAHSEARIDAAYAHMLLHRQEGQELSAEGGPDIRGWNNAKFWVSIVRFGQGKPLGAPKAPRQAPAAGSKSPADCRYLPAGCRDLPAGCRQLPASCRLKV